jgi:hypothetical protein
VSDRCFRRDLLTRLILGAGLLTLVCEAGAAHAQAIYNPPPGQNLEGVWLIEGDHATLKTLSGKLPPMIRSAAASYGAAVIAW